MSNRLGHSAGEAALYYEWHGDPDSAGSALLLIHGGGSTIQTNWGALLPELVTSRPVLAVELQGHGRTVTGDHPASFAGSAEALASLLAELDAPPIDVLGFSNGGQVALQLALRHPDRVRRLVVASSPFRRGGMVEGFWAGMEAGTFADLPAVYRDADFAVSRDPAHAERMFHLDREQMLTGFADVAEEELAGIRAPTLVVAGDRDVVTRQHAVALAGAIPGARLLLVPGNHGDYLGEILASGGDLSAMHRTLPFLLDFLDGAEDGGPDRA